MLQSCSTNTTQKGFTAVTIHAWQALAARSKQKPIDDTPRDYEKLADCWDQVVLRHGDKAKRSGDSARI